MMRLAESPGETPFDHELFLFLSLFMTVHTTPAPCEFLYTVSLVVAPLPFVDHKLSLVN